MHHTNTADNARSRARQEQQRRRAADRLPPLADGRRDPLRPATDAPTRRSRFAIAA